MKNKTTTILVFLFLVLMVGASAASAFVGYKIGYQSLKGVSQPDINPTKKLRNKEQVNKDNKGLTLVDEKKILVQNYDYIVNQSKKNTGKQTAKTREKAPSNKEKNQDNSETKKLEKNLYLQAKKNDIILELKKFKKEDEALVFDVNLTNNGSKAVSFIYSFLELKDDKDKFLSAFVDGLPRELPANGNKYSGTIRISSSLLTESEKLFLTLTDYPEQNIKLQINNIPVKINN